MTYIYSKSSIPLFIGRVLLASIFIVTAIKGIMFNFGGFVGMINSKGLPYPFYLAVFVLSLKLFAGLSIASGRNIELSSSALIIFMTIATIIYHNPLSNPDELLNMLRNLAIIGGLIILKQTNSYVNEVNGVF